MTQTINRWAILGATVAGMFIGFLFYGLLFNSAWTQAVGLTTEDDVNFLKYGESVALDPVTPMLINAFVMAAYAVFLWWLTDHTGHATLAGGATLGAMIGLLVAASHGVGNLFAFEPAMLTVIDGLYHIVLFTVIGAIVGRWHNIPVR
ncbi:hypothetical protein GGR28_003706 [Lewinella aquimaris]|uniref:DUF1761 domain-containing protein n=1 Tax=Neolewinella aquimaris TaxID=1835722 RepID=A0A840EGX6_9BACT|nr:DUF1761 domain-containing protein [Neolewinella aquimaris]MBB4081059.1 hypothetical protein [Neolewinella aquimaris]